MQRLFRLNDAPWRLQGAGAVLLVHAYSMYVYFYLFTRARPRLARRVAARGGREPGRRTVACLPPRASFPCSIRRIGGAALLTFMTSLGSFSAPYIFGGGFRVMTTQIVAPALNGDNELAMVETISLTLLALVALPSASWYPMPRRAGRGQEGGRARRESP